MKKTVSFIIGTMFVFGLMTGCFQKAYSVDYCGQKHFYHPAKGSYKPGTEVTLSCNIAATDTDYAFYLDDKPLIVQYDNNKGYSICFTMPNHNVKLECIEKNTVANTQTDSETEAVSKIKPTETAQAAVSMGIQTLDLQKQLYGLAEWEDDLLLVSSQFSHVTLWYEDAVKYPELAEVLEQTATMVKRSMEDEFDNFCASVGEDRGRSREDFQTWVSALDIQVRRADSVVISLLSDSYSDYGEIEDFRGMHGSNYDTQTGQEVKLTEVIKEMSKIPEIVLKELNSHIWAGEFYSDIAVENYFRNTPEDGISWTLDYNGVTFYFADGDLMEAGGGRQTATIAFAQYPELFVEKYMVVPDAYMVELPLDSSFFTALDGDDDLEELNVTGFYDSDMGFYTKFGIYTDRNGYYHYEECFADGFIPYYVKTRQGDHYLYLFCKENEGELPRFTLNVIDVSGGKLTNVGTMHVGPGYLPADVFRVPTNANQFYLDDFDGMAQGMMVYTVGARGLPERKE